MPISRRSFMALSTAAAAAAAFSATPTRAAKPAMTDDRFFDWKPVATSGDIAAHAAFGFGGNALLIVAKGGALLVDCKFAYCGPQLRREAEAIAATKLTHAVNTHHHGDHTGGNHAITPDLPLFAQTNATPRILGQKARYISQVKEAATSLNAKTGPAVEQVRKDALALYHRVESLKITEFAPKTTFDKDYEIDLGGSGGGLKVQLHHYGPGHTDNDIVVHIPALNLLHTGDLVFNRLHPYIDADGGGATKTWIASLKKAIELCDAKTKVVPGHGELCDVQALHKQVEYFEKMREIVGRQVKLGKTRKEVAELKPTLFEGYGNTDRLGMALAAIYGELTKD
jgi:glyoxylase-like metal-dependent hydrolase (beta-lactamase superfamily II)